MTRFMHLQDEEAVSAIRVGARQAVRDALHGELVALEEVQAMLGKLYLIKAWLTVDEVATYVGCDAESVEGRAKAVRKMHEAGLPYVVVGRQRLTARAELDEWLSQQSRSVPSMSAKDRPAVPAKRRVNRYDIWVCSASQALSMPGEPMIQRWSLPDFDAMSSDYLRQ